LIHPPKVEKPGPLRKLNLSMNDPYFSRKLGVSVVCVLLFLFTLPPIGLLLFLDLFAGLNTESILQAGGRLDLDVLSLVPVCMVIFGALAFGAMKAQRSEISMALFFLIISITIMSMSGCVMGFRGFSEAF